MEINSIIIDDEPNNIQNLQTILQTHCPNVKVLATAQNADDGIDLIKKYKPSLVFLDIQMPRRSGFDVLTAFNEPDFEVIFITAYDQYGIQAIKFSALDYLLKPINIQELQNAVIKAGKKINNKDKDKKLENLIANIKHGQKEMPKIALPTLKEIRYIKVDQIVRCEAFDNYTTIFTTGVEQILVCKTLKEFAELLKQYGFIRAHQSHLVNIEFVKSLLKEDGGTLLMDDNAKIPISRQNREDVKAALKRML
ncbi:LytR/AlgR family response regulator transcription factor [Mucilaginibacter auburnensis]|uniref:Two-component system LytT family response regulator n=1 Tax=Mucilaginibacter auburnensis TaxID=1457233 RepID=A0A2H9VQ60_9SPHI|nr:LytTR family DNA-binding domain-containing protein [Mucilaginibacter auburnensis]PJJ80467.1 two-component system LytT family response regulator [Mucilaginibacter auburnensis]